MPRSLRLVLALALIGCGSPDPDPDAGSEDAGAAMDAGGPGCDAGAGDPLGCEDLTPDPTCEERWVVAVQGDVETAEGAPVEGARPQLCARVAPAGALICLAPPETDAAGAFTIVVPEEIRCLEEAAMRVLAPGQPFGTTYCPIDLGADGSVVDVAEPYALVPVTAATVPPRGDGRMERDVVFGGGVTLGIAPDGIAGDGYEALAGGPASVDPAPCFADGVALDGAYVFAPEGTILGGAPVRIPNDDCLAPGTVVDLYVLGGLETELIDGTPVDEAELVTFGTATVSADGSEIVSDLDVRLPYLSWLAWRAR